MQNEAKIGLSSQQTAFANQIENILGQHNGDLPGMNSINTDSNPDLQINEGDQLSMPPLTEQQENSNSVILFKYLLKYKKDSDYQKFRIAQMRVNAIQHNSARYVKSPFLPVAFETMKEMKKPEVLKVASPPDPKMVNLFYETFPEISNEVPTKLRTEFFQLAKPSLLPFKSRANLIEQAQSDMFFVCQGSMLQCQTKEIYDDFLAWEQHKDDEARMSSSVKDKPNWSKMAKVGRVILAFVLKSRSVQTHIEFKKEYIKAKEFEDQISSLVGLKKVETSECFGDFSELNGRPYKPQCNIAMRVPTMVLRINPADVKALFQNSLSFENMNTVQSIFPTMKLKNTMMRKLCRCFVEKQIPPKVRLIKEGETCSTIYILKSGAVKMLRNQDPFNVKIANAKARQPTKKSKKGVYEDDDGNQEFMDEKISLEPNEKSELGLTQTNIPGSMRRFNIMEISEGSTFGQEALYTEKNQLNYSIETIKQCTVWEIALEDFKVRIGKEYLENDLKDQCFEHMIQRLMRVKGIYKACKNFNEQSAMKKFYNQSLSTIQSLHPHATKKIMKSKENEFQIEGTIRVYRETDNLRINEISLDDQKVAQLDEEQKKQKLGHSEEKKNTHIKLPPHTTFIGGKILSPTGVVIQEERKGRKKRIDMKAQQMSQDLALRTAKPAISSIAFFDIPHRSEIFVGDQTGVLQTMNNSGHNSPLAMQSLDKTSPMFGSGLSIHQSMMHVSAVREVDDSENYTSDGSVASLNAPKQKQQYELPREVKEVLNGVVDLQQEPIENQPVFINLPDSQSLREQKEPLKEWRAQTVDLCYTERGKTYLMKQSEKTHKAFIFNKAAAQKEKEAQLSTPRMLFSLPNNAPALSQRYGLETNNDYEALNTSPRKMLQNDSSKSPRQSKMQKSPRPQGKFNQSLKETKYKVWKDIMFTMEHRSKDQVMHQSSLYQSQMITDKKKQALMDQSFAVNEHKKEIILQNLSFQSGRQGQLNQTSSIMMALNDDSSMILPQQVGFQSNLIIAPRIEIEDELYQEEGEVIISPTQQTSGEQTPYAAAGTQVAAMTYQTPLAANLTPEIIQQEVRFTGLEQRQMALIDLEMAMSKDMKTMSIEDPRDNRQHQVSVVAQLSVSQTPHKSQLKPVQEMRVGVETSKLAKLPIIDPNHVYNVNKPAIDESKTSEAVRDANLMGIASVPLTSNKGELTPRSVIVSEKIANLKAVREKVAATNRSQAQVRGGIKFSENQGPLTDIKQNYKSNIVADMTPLSHTVHKQSEQAETELGDDGDAQSVAQSYRQGTMFGNKTERLGSIKQKVSKVNSPCANSGATSQIEQFNNYIKSTKRNKFSAVSSSANFQTGDMDRMALLRKSAQANMAQRVRESVHSNLGGSRLLQNGRLSSVQGEHGSSMYNFDQKEHIEGGFQIRQFNLSKKPEPVAQYDVQSKRRRNKSRFSRTKTGEIDIDAVHQPIEDMYQTQVLMSSVMHNEQQLPEQKTQPVTREGGNRKHISSRLDEVQNNYDPASSQADSKERKQVFQKKSAGGHPRPEMRNISTRERMRRKMNSSIDTEAQIEQEFNEAVMNLEDQIEMKKTPAPSFIGTKSKRKSNIAVGKQVVAIDEINSPIAKNLVSTLGVASEAASPQSTILPIIQDRATRNAEVKKGKTKEAINLVSQQNEQSGSLDQNDDLDEKEGKRKERRLRNAHIFSQYDQTKDKEARAQLSLVRKQLMKKLRRRRKRQQESRLAVEIERAANEREQQQVYVDDVDYVSSHGYSDKGFMVPSNLMSGVIPPGSSGRDKLHRPLSPLERSPKKKNKDVRIVKNPLTLKDSRDFFSEDPNAAAAQLFTSTSGVEINASARNIGISNYQNDKQSSRLNNKEARHPGSQERGKHLITSSDIAQHRKVIRIQNDKVRVVAGQDTLTTGKINSGSSKEAE